MFVYFEAGDLKAADTNLEWGENVRIFNCLTVNSVAEVPLKYF